MQCSGRENSERRGIAMVLECRRRKQEIGRGSTGIVEIPELGNCLLTQ